jgi:hypothetical protein
MMRIGVACPGQVRKDLYVEKMCDVRILLRLAGDLIFPGDYMRKIIVLFIFLLFGGNVKSEVAINIERIQCVSLGQVVEVAITLENPSPGLEMGGFDLLFRYHSALSLQTVEMGQLLADCQWEYFTFSLTGGNGVRIIAIADINNGPYHPTCYGDSSGVLASATFQVTNDQSVEGDFLPIRWWWYDCGDNTISSRTGDTLFISDDIYDFDGDSQFVITYDTTFPTPFGAPGECLGGDGVERFIDFYNGGVDVTNNDTESPVANCPADITVDNDPDQCGAVVSFSATVDDNCPGATIGCTPASGTFFAVGTSVVTCIAIDASGNADTCLFNVTVNDTAYPVANCASDTTVGNEPGQCGAVVDFSATVSDNCPASIHCTPASGTFFTVGTTPVICVAVDGSGYGDVCTLSVTVNDTEAPVVVCPDDITVGNDPDQCGVVPPSGSQFGIGTTPVQVIATDAVGHADTCQFNVVVNDTARPVVCCPLDIEVPNDSGEYGAVVNYDISATDNCPDVAVSANPPSGTLFPVGTTTVEVVATDVVGNADTCSFNITLTTVRMIITPTKLILIVTGSAIAATCVPIATVMVLAIRDSPLTPAILTTARIIITRTKSILIVTGSAIAATCVPIATVMVLAIRDSPPTPAILTTARIIITRTKPILIMTGSAIAATCVPIPTATALAIRDSPPTPAILTTARMIITRIRPTPTVTELVMPAVVPYEATSTAKGASTLLI